MSDPQISDPTAPAAAAIRLPAELGIEAAGALVFMAAIVASGLVADRYGRRRVLWTCALLTAAFSGFAPQLLDAGAIGEIWFMFSGFALLGVTFVTFVVLDRAPIDRAEIEATAASRSGAFADAALRDEAPGRVLAVKSCRRRASARCSATRAAAAR